MTAYVIQDFGTDCFAAFKAVYECAVPVVAAVNGTELREKLISQGYEVHASTPAEYAAYIRREIERWTPIVKAAGIKPQ